MHRMLFSLIVLLCLCLCMTIFPASAEDTLPLPDGPLDQLVHVPASQPLFPTPSPAPTRTPKPTPETIAEEEEDDDPFPFAIRYGNRDVNEIAITMDDCYTIQYVRETFELVQSLGVPITFYPLGVALHAEDAGLWQAIAASDCEIGTHTQQHGRMGFGGSARIYANLMRPQEILDGILGYHYPIRTVRPPYGNYLDENGRSQTVAQVLRKAGFRHVILWDVSQTNARKALSSVRNGSILLYHARPADIQCLRELIPALKEKGFRFVTVSELTGLEPLATSTDLYTFEP